jgi:uncharacterized membrane protein YfcA
VSQVSWSIPLAMGISAVTVAQIASRIKLPIADSQLRKFFAYFLFTVAAFSLIERIFIV